MNQAELLKKALEPKSDQLNADDLIGGPITIKIRRVTVAAAGEQRVAFYYDGDNEKPYKPGKSMGRLILELWGDEPANYIGRSMTLYRDPEIVFGKDKVGGIRISHLSNISEEKTTSITVKKSIRKPFTVKPLRVDSSTPPTLSADQIAALKTAGKTEAKLGSEKLRVWWSGIGSAAQKAVGGAEFIAQMKTIAEAANSASITTLAPSV